MGFLTGLVTGAAKSIDEQLKTDMKRTEERMAGMEQYRVTRRRAKLEAQEKEKKELRDTLNTLASYTDGDENKALQLFNAGGKTIAGASYLAETLRVNREAGKDIGTVIKFAEANAGEGDFTSFIDRNVTPITPLANTGEQMQASGLYSLFKPDVQGKLDKRVDAAAPLPTTQTTDAFTAQATIDYTKLLSAEEATEVKAERERAASMFDMTTDQMSAQTESTLAAITRADKAEKRLQDALELQVSDTEADNLRADAKLALDEANLALAQDEADERVKDRLGERKLQGVELLIKEQSLKKLTEAPAYATYEAMAVAADAELAVLQSKPQDTLSAGDTQRIKELETMRKTAFKGLVDETSATTDPSSGTPVTSLSKESRNSILNAEIKRVLEPLGLVKDIEGKLEYALEGNELSYLDSMNLALDNVVTTVDGLKDTQMNNLIKSQRNTLDKFADKYINKQLNAGVVPKVVASEEELSANIKNGTYKAGDIIEYEDNGVIVNFIWTGSDIL